MMKATKVMLTVLLIAALLGSCAGGTGSKETTAQTIAGEKSFTIVTSFYPMYVSTINIAKDIAGVQVVNMTKPQTGCLHDYQMTPGDLVTLENADAFVVNGAGMESFLDDVIARQKNLKIVEASKGIELLQDDSGEENAHVWVSITNAITQAENIAGQLALIDTANAEKYRSNADAYIVKLTALKTKMHASLDALENRDIVTFHEAFPYFAQEFNLNIVAVIEREPGTAPTPKELEDTITIVKNAKTQALFAEPQYSVKIAQTIADATGAKIFTLDPGVTGESNSSAYNNYIDMMEENLGTLMEALGV